MTPKKAPSPYARAAAVYIEHGWSPVPLPAERKTPVPDGFTGAAGKWVDLRQAREWIVSGRSKPGLFPPGNIALRLPRDVLGLDVDMYDGKAGRSTLAAAEAELGELPPTWVTGSREDGSGIRLFRIPAGLGWPGDLGSLYGDGIELVRWDHRYAIVTPSLHDKTRALYRWRRPDGEWVEDEIPEIGDLAELPAEWVEKLTSGREWVDRASANLSDTEAGEWLSGLAGAADPMCEAMSATVARYGRAIREAGADGGAHDRGRDGVWAVIGDAAGGHTGVLGALDRLRKIFLAAISDRRGKKAARDEWAREVWGGVRKVAAEGEPESVDPCSLISGDWKPASGGEGGGEGSGEGKPPRGSGAFDFERDDIGNAQRFANARRGDALYCEPLGGWLVYRSGVWEVDSGGQVDRWAMEVVRKMGAEAAFIEDPEARAAFKKWVKSSGAAGKLTAMTGLARSLNGMRAEASDFDPDPFALGVAGGQRLQLLRNPGVQVGPAIPEHRLTRATAATWKPGARDAAWDAFLARIQPSDPIRDWLQRMVGYSLQAGNPARLFCVGYGPTSTGKTTFATALAAALGGYAAFVNLTVFRDNQDERGRPDLVDALGRRIVFAEEASAQWHLHPDQIKRITGGAPIRARLLFAKGYVEQVPSFTPWLLTNAVPTIDGADAALRRRVKVIPFIEQIASDEDDVSLRSRFVLDPAARSAVLAWAVEGWKKYCDNPDLDAPAEAFAIADEFSSGMSELDACLSEIAVIEEEAHVYPAALYAAYLGWCEANGVPARDRVTQTKLGRMLSGLGIPRKSVRTDDGPRWMRSGIRLTKEWERVVGGTP